MGENDKAPEERKEKKFTRASAPDDVFYRSNNNRGVLVGYMTAVDWRRKTCQVTMTIPGERNVKPRLVLDRNRISEELKRSLETMKIGTKLKARYRLQTGADYRARTQNAGQDTAGGRDPEADLPYTLIRCTSLEIAEEEEPVSNMYLLSGTLTNRWVAASGDLLKLTVETKRRDRNGEFRRVAMPHIVLRTKDAPYWKDNLPTNKDNAYFRCHMETHEGFRNGMEVLAVQFVVDDIYEDVYDFASKQSSVYHVWNKAMENTRKASIFNF